MIVNRKMEISQYKMQENTKKVAIVRSQCAQKGTVSAIRFVLDLVHSLYFIVLAVLFY